MKATYKSFRPWKRDIEVLQLISKVPYTVSQIGKLKFPPCKKASERLKKYLDSGLACRMQSPAECPHGKGEFIYWVSPSGYRLLTNDLKK